METYICRMLRTKTKNERNAKKCERAEMMNTNNAD